MLPVAHESFETSNPERHAMLARQSQHDTTEHWSGHWGADARFYARRSDGVCFAIDGRVNVIDLAASTPPSSHARAVESLPQLGRYTLSVFAVRPLDASAATPSDEGQTAGESPSAPGRLLAYGVRRRA
jgi:hypothetical protein